MSTIPEPREAAMAREVKVLYFDTMKNNYEFHRQPYLDMDWFKTHFATVAHRHSIFHREGTEGRKQYNLYFRLVRQRLSDAIKRLAQNEAKQHRPTTPATQVVPTITPKQPKQLWLGGYEPQTEVTRNRLQKLRGKLAARPDIRP